MGALSILAAGALAVGGCQLELSDGNTSGNGGGDANPVATAEDGGTSNVSGSTPSAQGGAASNGQGGANTASRAGSDVGAEQAGSTSSPTFSREDCGHPDQIPNDDQRWVASILRSEA